MGIFKRLKKACLKLVEPSEAIITPKEYARTAETTKNSEAYFKDVFPKANRTTDNP